MLKQAAKGALWRETMRLQDRLRWTADFGSDACLVLFMLLILPEKKKQKEKMCVGLSLIVTEPGESHQVCS